MKLNYRQLFNASREIIKESVDEWFDGNPDCWEMGPDEDDPDFPDMKGVWYDNDAACFGYFKAPDKTYRMVVSPLSENERKHCSIATVRFSNEIFKNLNETEVLFYKYIVSKVQEEGYKFLHKNVDIEDLEDKRIEVMTLNNLRYYLTWQVGINSDKLYQIYPEYLDNNMLKGARELNVQNFLPDCMIDKLSERILAAYKDGGQPAQSLSRKAIYTYFSKIVQNDESSCSTYLLNARYGYGYAWDLNRNSAKRAGRLWYDKKFIAFWGSTPSPEEMKTILTDITNDEGYEGPPYEELVQTYILGVKHDKAVFLRDYMSPSMKNVEVGKDNGMDIRIPHEANPMEKERLRKKLGVKRVQGNYGSEFIPKDMRPGELMAQYRARKYQESRSLIGKILREEIIKVVL